MIAVLLDPDPQRLNEEKKMLQAYNYGNSPQKVPSIGKKIKGSFSVIDEEEEEDEELLSGLINSLKLFNASKNRISDAGAAIVSTFLQKSQMLETLLLHWNKIRSKGSCSLAKALKKNTIIQILDLSFNSLGSGAKRKALLSKDQKKEEDVGIEQRHQLDKFECTDSAWKWRRAFMKNHTLLHVDVSFNGFSAEDMVAVGDGLRENHTILGCHIEGNSAKMDALGFVNPILNI